MRARVCRICRKISVVHGFSGGLSSLGGNPGSSNHSGSHNIVNETAALQQRQSLAARAAKPSKDGGRDSSAAIAPAAAAASLGSLASAAKLATKSSVVRAKKRLEADARAAQATQWATVEHPVGCAWAVGKWCIAQHGYVAEKPTDMCDIYAAPLLLILLSSASRQI